MFILTDCEILLQCGKMLIFFDLSHGDHPGTAFDDLRMADLSCTF